MKKQLLTILFVLGLSAAVALAQAGSGAAAGNPPSQGQMGQPPSQMGQPGVPSQAGTSADQSQASTTSTKDSKDSSMANVDDESLHRQVHEQLASNPDLQNVQITVKNGAVTLDGTVAKKEDKK
jgi:osmotically-inducible protein OsmY